MNRVEFINQLESLLWDIPESDRLDAIAYYNDYFDEAGPENEANVLRELGSPERVASIIKADLNTAGNEKAEYTEQGYSDGRSGVNQNAPVIKKRKWNLPIPLVIVILVFASPILLGIGGGFLGGVLGIFVSLIGLIVGGLGMFVGGIASLIVGLIKLASEPIGGLVLIGTGSLITALGILFVLLMVLCAFKWFPKLFHNIINWVQQKIYNFRGGV